MTSKLTRERLEELAAGQSGFNLRIASHEESQELARMTLAAMDSEPVEWLNGCNKSVPAALRYLAENPRPIGGESSFNTAHLYQLAREIELMAEGTLYRHAQPAPVAQPVMFIDGDISSEDADKLAKVIREFNEEDERPLAKMARIIRENPHPTNECDMPKAQPAPVVQDAATAIRACLSEFPESVRDIVEECADIAENACRAAMLQAEPVTTANKLGNSPVTTDTWISVSERMPENDVSVLTFDGMYKRVHHAMYGHWQCWEPEKITHWQPLPAAPQEVQGE